MRQVKGTVFVGLSGGVDSSVSAALLVKAGYKVVGVFIKVWEPPGYPCVWRDDRREAMRVAARLDIPLLTLDLEKIYKREVVDYLIGEYARGRTPNPDVMCNRHIKFGAFYDWSMERGADYVATGHYAQIKNNKLLASKDKEKDQTYFLWTLKTQQLKHILFPVGHLHKTEVRKLASKFGLSNATKKDSQGLCFIGKVDVKDFLKRYLKTKSGLVLNDNGELVGEHEGAIFYTIGERHGFKINKKTASDKPYYIVSRDLVKNILVVSQNKKIIDKLNSRIITLEQINLLSKTDLNKLTARIRHRGELVPCVLNQQGKSLTIEFTARPPSAIASGQSLVIYRGNECLGGGIISV